MRRAALVVVGVVVAASSACSGGGGLPCSDGDRVVTWRDSDQHRQLVVTDGHGRDATAITPRDGNAEEPSFSGDGGEVAYIDGLGDWESSGPYEYTIWTVRADGSRRTRITGPEEWDDDGLTGYTGEDTAPDWSPTRDEIVYSHRGPSPEHSDLADPTAATHGLFVVVPGDEPRRLTDTADPQVVDDAPAWSPDGERVAFIRSGDPAQAEQPTLWLVDRDGGNVTSVATVVLGEAMRWSPDGGSIVLAGDRFQGEPGPGEPPRLQFRSIDLATGVETVLGPPVGAFEWSADGERLFTIDPLDKLAVTHLTDDPPTVEQRPMPEGRPLRSRFDLAACN